MQELHRWGCLGERQGFLAKERKDEHQKMNRWVVRGRVEWVVGWVVRRIVG